MSMTNQTRDIARFSAQAKNLADAAAAFSSRAELALHGVYEISKILSVPARLEATLSNVLTLLSSFLEMRHGMIALLADDGAPRAVVGVGWSEDHAKAYFERLPERAIGQIVATKMPVVIEDVAKNPLFSEWYAAEREPTDCRISFIGVPIKEREKVIGTLTIDRIWDNRANFRLDEDVRFLVMIANLVGQTVRLHNVIGRDRERLMDEQRRLEKELSGTAGTGDREVKVRGVVGQSEAIRNVMDKIKIVARSNTTVLLRGESGTGKELFAHATHELSPRKKGPFIKLNCAALPESMLESELFGHEKGSFTGAVNQRKGRFELADKGTLFLDEIGEISPAFQAKLLRVLQEGEFERVGGTRTLKIDVRFVFATNKNLEEAVSRGEFRSDLYYRINVVSIQLPPLRERADDINLLAREFLHRFNDEHGTHMSLTTSAQRVLESCYFPGNVRELENCVRRTATLARDAAIVADDFACRNDTCLSATLWKGLVSTREPLRILKAPVSDAELAPASPPPAVPSVSEAPGPVRAAPKPADLPEDANELDRLVHAMETAGWVQAKAARLLNMTPRQIGYALRKHNIPIKRF
ncbi:Nif-specific regulatory protein [Methylovirgula ligni]|uniref:Nif-specific regulatory protein n=1 Tax=Methylovirgula ligni TaxID=569860 RepID=A0A3D9Z3N6_9HYPH|nr:nif-specific transcriptional activator NifA [Methylovirgula ligni]REF88908.1 Nif-specific regulatory protein [Methylovirgula ligni]